MSSPIRSPAARALLTMLFLASYHPFVTPYAAAQRLSLPPGWSFSTDLSFPSSSSSLNSYTDIAPFSLFVPVLSSSSFNSGSKGFSLGFLSLFETPSSSPSQIVLSICLGVSGNGPSSSPFLVPVCTLNNNTSPLKQQGKEQLVKLEVDDQSKRLSLVDGDGREVWAVGDVGSMEMQSDGNLVIFDSRNESTWESFDNPSDSLVQGQRLRLGMELTSSNNMYKALMQEGGVLFYEVSANYWPLAYWIYPANNTVGQYFSSMVTAFSLDKDAPINLTSSLASPICSANSSFNLSQAHSVLHDDRFVIQDACSNINTNIVNSTTDLFKLDTDGNMRDYHLLQLANSSYVVTSTSSNYQPCYTPNVCGTYGICSVSSTYGTAISHNCRCPSETDNKNFSNAFSTIDVSNPSQGCERKVALECGGQLASQSLEAIQRVSFMAMLPLFERTWEENTMSLEACKAACSSNCSCSGFFYHTKSSFCLPFGDTTPLFNVSFISLPSDENVAYVKLQKAAAAESKSLPAIVSAAVIVPVIVIVLVASVVYWKWKQYTMDPELKLAEQELLGVLPMPPTRYSYQELRKSTQNFSKRLGSGGFGSVYEGLLPDGRRVAVKNLEHMSRGQKEFLAEIATIGGTSHVNIVGLYGFCSEKRHRLLVYEYMDNGSLDRWLFCKEGDQQVPVMNWETRFNVALGTARGLAYLHEECPQPILHFDVKPQNILLDGNLDAKLADFGLAKLVARGQSSVNTVVRGTPGYIAPEWVSHSIVSKKCDVYSFGMVLLELVSGRKNVEVELIGSEEYYFPKWAAKMTREGKFADLMDKKLVKSMACGEEGIMEQVKTVISVALLCIHEEPEMRPSMTVLCGMLDGSIALSKDIPAVVTTPIPVFKFTSSGNIESGNIEITSYSLLEGR